MGPIESMPALPDHWGVIEEATDDFPFRLATSPARNFLNSTFTETPTSQAKEGRPTVMVHPADAAALGVVEGEAVLLESPRGSVTIAVTLFDGVRRGVLIAESIWPDAAYPDGKGINHLTGADSPAPFRRRRVPRQSCPHSPVAERHLDVVTGAAEISCTVVRIESKGFKPCASPSPQPSPFCCPRAPRSPALPRRISRPSRTPRPKP